MTHHLPAAFGAAPRKRPSNMTALVAHLDAAYNLARWLMRNETEAEDAVQDAYVRAIGHFDGFWGGDARAWLLKIVRNTCYDRMKQQGALERATNFDDPKYDVDRQTPDPEAAFLLAERNELLEKSLADLPTEFREILVLRELEQLSYRQIANIAEIPLGTVMSRLNRARQRLRETFCPARNER
jgi:RNA polymerase sigma-70 factor (ECF subfamily)